MSRKNKNPYEKRVPLADEEASQQAEIFFQNYYEDRGMLKWQGYFLSDHTAALRQQEKESSIVVTPQPQQSSVEIGKLLQEAWNQHHQIIIQTNELDCNQQPQEVTGVVLGNYEDKIILQKTDGTQIAIQVEQIKNIRRLY